MSSVLQALLPFLHLLVPVLVMLVVATVKRWVVPAVGRLNPRMQQAVVAIVAAVVTAVLQAKGISVPDGAALLSPEVLETFLYAMLGAMGVHAAVKAKSTTSPTSGPQPTG